jgi:deoxyribonuclease V
VGGGPRCPIRRIRAIAVRAIASILVRPRVRGPLGDIGVVSGVPDPPFPTAEPRYGRGLARDAGRCSRQHRVLALTTDQLWHALVARPGHDRAVWPASPDQLIVRQCEVAVASPALWRPHAGVLAIGACAVCFARGHSGRGSAGDRAWAAAAVLRGRQVIAEATAAGVAGAAYVPGLLALREGPLLEAAVRALGVWPDVLLVDATGRDHPRRGGLALQLGAILDLPTVGVTHRPLLAAGEWPEDRRGATAPLLLDGELVGVWLRTRAGARPVAVHIGWRTDLDTAVEAVQRAGNARRTPEPLRRARTLVRTSRGRQSGPAAEP